MSVKKCAVPLAALLACVVVGGVSTVASVARADEQDGTPSTDPAAEARRRYNLGTQAYTSKRFVEAALNFEAAAYQRPHAVTLYTAALAWEQANQTERAADDFSRALEVNGLSTQQAATARERLATYEAMLGTVLVNAPDGCRVQLDALTEVATPARLHGTAGVHSLAVRMPGRAIERRDVLLEVGQTQKVDLDATSAPAAVTAKENGTKPPPVAPLVDVAPPKVVTVEAPRGADLRRTLGFVSIGVGAAAVGGAVVLGLQSLGARDAYDAAPTLEALDHARALETWTTVSWIAGGLFVAGGVALVLWPSSEDKQHPPKERDARLRLSPGVTGAVLQGAF